MASLRIAVAFALFGCTQSPSPEATCARNDGVVEIDAYTTSLTNDGHLAPGQVALTFDDGPTPDTTRRILDVLDAHGVHATFFQVGVFADANPDVTAEIIARGHALGTHTYSHPDLTTLPLNQALAELDRGDAAVTAAAGGVRPSLFRFPQFSSTPELVAAANDRGLAVVHANILSEDWLTSDPDEVYARTLAALDAEGRGIVLFHDTMSHTAEVLDRLLTEIEARGYEIVTIRPRPRLADLGRQRGIHVGSVVFTPYRSADRRAWRRALTEFDLFTVPAFFRLVRPDRSRFDFTLPDETATAAPPGTVLRVHNLIWCEQLPDWVTPGLTGAELGNILVEHVRTVIEHYETAYPGRVVAYDVVNEPLSFTGNTCPWHRIGLDAGVDELAYVRLALQTARTASPTAKLYINDFGIEGQTERANRMVALATDLIGEGVPLDGVGLQAHFVVGSQELFGPMPPVDEIKATMARYTALGLEVSITEADQAIPDDRRSPANLDAQARAFGGLAHACIDTNGCSAFVTWGIGDADSWIPGAFPGWGAPLLFDAEYQAKPAYEAVRATLGCEAASKR